ncbi:hypothetical protein D3C73_920160 [compost metagenome]
MQPCCGKSRPGDFKQHFNRYFGIQGDLCGQQILVHCRFSNDSPQMAVPALALLPADQAQIIPRSIRINPVDRGRVHLPVRIAAARHRPDHPRTLNPGGRRAQIAVLPGLIPLTELTELLLHPAAAGKFPELRQQFQRNPAARQHNQRVMRRLTVRCR